jgi:Holliday junction resolvase RusA-like endonuclease
MQSIVIEIPIVPKAQKRARSRIAGKSGRQFVQVYTDKEQRSEQENFKAMLYRQLPDGFQPIQGAISLRVHALMPIPQCSKRMHQRYTAGEIYHTKKPDLDNLIKNVKDCAKGVLWLDDRQVVGLIASKRYSDHPRWNIELEWD